MKAPLADKIRPVSIDDMVGQKHLLSPGMALRNIIDSGEMPNLIFYGPSGVGKTHLMLAIKNHIRKIAHFIGYSFLGGFLLSAFLKSFFFSAFSYISLISNGQYLKTLR